MRTDTNESNLGRFGGHVDRATLIDEETATPLLKLEGWLLHQDSRIASLRLGFTKEDAIPVTRSNRPDVAMRLPDLGHAISSGYTVTIPASHSLPPKVDITFIAELEDGDVFSSTFPVEIPRSRVTSDSLKHTASSETSPYGDESSVSTLMRLNRLALQSFLSSRERILFPVNHQPLISVILVLYNRADMTYACLRSLLEQEQVGIELIIVDNASTDETPMLLDRIVGARVIKNESNLHFISAANTGATYAQGEYLLFLNNDAVLLPGTLSAAVQAARTNGRIGAVGGKIIRPDGLLQEAGSVIYRDGTTSGIGNGKSPNEPAFKERRLVDYCSGAFLLTPRKLFYQLRMFDEGYSPAYYEDADYCVRLQELGFQVLYEPRAAIVHAQNSSSENHRDAERAITRNRPLFFARHREFLLGKERSGKETQFITIEKPSDSRLLLIDDFIPRKDRGQGLPRAHAMLHNLRALGFKITLLALKEGRRIDRGEFPDIPPDIEIISHLTEKDVEGFLSERFGVYAYAIISRPYNMELFQKLRTKLPGVDRNMRIIYDAEAIFAMRSVLQYELEFGTKLSQEEVREVVDKELEVARAVDAILAVSEGEAVQFANFGYHNVFVLAHGVASMLDDAQHFASRKGILSVSPILTEDTPNFDSTRWFLKEIFPRIAPHLPMEDSFFSLVGENCSEEIQRLSSGSVRLLGSIANLKPIYASHRIFVAPTRFSAGVPIKVIEAAANGIPVVATPLVASQLEWSGEEEIIIGSTPEEFARQCVRLYTDSELWRRIRKNAFRRISIDYSPSRFTESLKAVFRAVNGNLELP